MKIFAILLFCFITLQCATQTLTAEQQALIKKYEIPEFSHADITHLALEYAQFSEDVKIALETGNAIRLHKLTNSAVKIAKKINQTNKKMTPEDAAKWAIWATEISKAAFE